MKIYTTSLVSQYALIVCLSVALLFVQVFKLHMHIQHEEAPAPTGHVVDIHAAYSLHEITHETHPQHDHHAAAIDISADSYVKKVELFKLFVLLFLITSIIWCVPRLLCFHRQYLLKVKPIPLYYLLHPPLRAPPR